MRQGPGNEAGAWEWGRGLGMRQGPGNGAGAWE